MRSDDAVETFKGHSEDKQIATEDGRKHQSIRHDAVMIATRWYVRSMYYSQIRQET